MSKLALTINTVGFSTLLWWSEFERKAVDELDKDFAFCRR
jgi:hypothetical protein